MDPTWEPAEGRASARALGKNMSHRGRVKPVSGDVLKVFLAALYTFPFLGTAKHTNFVARAYADAHTRKTIAASMYLFHPSGETRRVGGVSIADSLRARIPVYYSKPMRGMYNEHAFKELLATLGVTQAHYEKVQERLSAATVAAPPPLYVISGRVDVDWKVRAPWHRVHVAHAWGANINGKDQSPYLVALAADTCMYRNRINAMARCCIAAAASVAISGRTVTLRIPGIGMGDFLPYGADKDAYADVLVVGFKRALARSSARANIRVEIVEYGVRGSLARAVARANVPNGTPDSTVYYALGNLFHPKPLHGGTASTDLMLVNAWDDRSFIGNGGAEDPTVDGFMVAAFRGGAALPNTSYLHNVFLAGSTLLTDRTRWVSC